MHKTLKGNEMNLKEVRLQARELSGRFDLINEDGTDNGFDFHLNEGMRYLDRIYLHSKTPARHFVTLESGDYYATFTLCRAIKEVWVATTTARTQLEKMDIQDFRASYPAPWNLVGSGTPLYYTPALLRKVPKDVQIQNMGGFIGYADVMIGDSHDYNGVLIAPKANAQLHMEVIGYFYTEALVNDTDENYWTSQHPSTLIMGAMRQIEVFNRNSEGRLDWERAIALQLDGVDKDVVEEELSEVDNMEG